jgi:hypothetical protein
MPLVSPGEVVNKNARGSRQESVAVEIENAQYSSRSLEVHSVRVTAVGIESILLAV